MYGNVNSREIKNIQRLAGTGMAAKAIAYQLTIHEPRVQAFMPKDPDIAKKEAKARAEARAATREKEAAKTDKMELNAARKRREKAKKG